MNKFPSPVTKRQIEAAVSYLGPLQSIPADQIIVDLSLTHADYHPTIDNFVTALYDNGMIQSFDWNAWWDEVERYRTRPTLLKSADFETCIKLLTAHVRADRFCTAHLASVIRSGHIPQILARLGEFASSIQ